MKKRYLLSIICMHLTHSLLQFHCLIEYVPFYSERGEMCAMKEVTLFSDDAKSKESAKQLMQVSWSPCRPWNFLYGFICILIYFCTHIVVSSFLPPRFYLAIGI